MVKQFRHFLPPSLFEAVLEGRYKVVKKQDELLIEELKKKIFEIVEANVHQWQERPIDRMPRVMTSVNTGKMRNQLFSLFKALAKSHKHCNHLVAEETGICLHCGEKVLKHRLDRPSREKIEEILISRCEGCVEARFGDARDASEFVAKERDQILAIKPTKEEIKKQIFEGIKSDLEPLMAEAIDISDWSFVQEYIRNLGGQTQGE